MWNLGGGVVGEVAGAVGEREQQAGGSQAEGGLGVAGREADRRGSGGQAGGERSWAAGSSACLAPPVGDVLRQVVLAEGRQQPLHPLLKALGGTRVPRSRDYRHVHVAAGWAGRGRWQRR